MTSTSKFKKNRNFDSAQKSKISDVRKPFIYLAGIAIILGLIGIFMLTGNFSGKVVLKTEILDKHHLSEVSIHNTLADCWIISDDLIYDITILLSTDENFVSLKNSCGQDASELVQSLSTDSKSVLDSYKVGILD